MVSLWPSSSLGHLLGKLLPELKCHFSLHFGYISVMSHGFYRRPGIEASFRLASGHTVPSRDASQPGSLWSTAQKTPPLRAVVSEWASSLFVCPSLPLLCALVSHLARFSFNLLPPPHPTPHQLYNGRGSRDPCRSYCISGLEERSGPLL